MLNIGKRIARLASRMVRDDDGVTAIEYGLLAALIAIVALGAVSAMGQTIYNVFWKAIPAGF